MYACTPTTVAVASSVANDVIMRMGAVSAIGHETS